jgi:hypothetical protein
MCHLYIFDEKEFFKKILEGIPDKKFQKTFSNLNISIFISADAVFHGDYEFEIIFVERCSLWYFYAQMGSYVATFAFFLHFTTKII